MIDELPPQAEGTRLSPNPLLIAPVAGALGPVAVDEALMHRLRETERALAQEHAVASLLQRVMVPDSLEFIEGVEVSARYESASTEARVGGDWFDVVRRNDASGFAMFVGDVAGHGIVATESMVQLRQWARLLSLDAETPSQLLRRLNGAARRFIEREMATALAAFVDFDTGTLEWATAGHPPLAVVDADGRGRVVHHEAIGMPLGVGDRWEGRDQQEDLSAVDAVVVYTDGLIERRGSSLDDGFDRLAAVLTSLAGGGLDQCDQVLTAMCDVDDLNDDACIVIARRTATPH